MDDTAGEAALEQHLMDSCGGETGILPQSLADELEVRIDVRGPHGLGAMKVGRFDGLPDGVGVESELSGDGADFPVFGIKVTANLGAGFRRNHKRLRGTILSIQK